jgi:hypothetical protein
MWSRQAAPSQDHEIVEANGRTRFGVSSGHAKQFCTATTLQTQKFPATQSMATDFRAASPMKKAPDDRGFF